MYVAESPIRLEKLHDSTASHHSIKAVANASLSQSTTSTSARLQGAYSRCPERPVSKASPEGDGYDLLIFGRKMEQRSVPRTEIL
jgi:hypothetical protein